LSAGTRALTEALKRSAAADNSQTKRAEKQTIIRRLGDDTFDIEQTRENNRQGDHGKVGYR